MQSRAVVVAACLIVPALGLPLVAGGQPKAKRLDPAPVILSDLREAGDEGYLVAGRWGMAAPLATAFIDDILLVGSGTDIFAYEASGSGAKLLSAVQTPGVVRRMRPYDRRLYVANDSAGVRVIDYRHPGRPEDLGGIAEWYRVSDVALTEELVLLAVHGDGLSIHKRSNLERVSQVALPGYARRVEVLGDTAFVTSGPAAGSAAEVDLYAVDISDPASPQVLAEKYESKTSVYDLAIHSRRGFVAEGSGGLGVIGLMGTRHFARLGAFVTSAISVAADGDLLYCAGERSFLVLDPSRTPPQLRGVYETDEVLSAAAARGNLAAAKSGGTKVQLISVERPTAPSAITTLDFPANAVGVFSKGDIVYVAAGSEHFEVLDVSDRSAPARIAELVGPGNAMAVSAQGDLVYVAARVGVAIIDAEKPGEPRVVGYVGLQTGEERYVGIAAQGTKMYVASGSKGLMIVDVTDPGKPAIISMTELKDWSYDLWVEGEMVYLADGRGLALVDAHDPAAPKLLNYIETPGEALDVVARDGIVFVAERDVGVEIYDWSDPEDPKLLSKPEEPGTCEGVGLKDNLLYAAAAENGVYVVDVTDPAVPKVVGSARTPGIALDVSPAEDFVAVADFTGGVAILQEITDDGR